MGALMTFSMAQASVLFVLALSGLTSAFTTDLTIKQCNQHGCSPSQKRVALDATSNGTEHLISANGSSLTLEYGGPGLGGPRVYLIEEENQNTMFMLNGQEFSFEIELSSMRCGFNAALYFVGMTANTGAADQGTKYCDAQAVDGTFCSEMDILEANTEAQQYTTHACTDSCGSYTEAVSECKGTPGSASSVCDQSGCGMNPFRYGPGTTYDTETDNAAWHGSGSDFKLDSSQPFTVVTRFDNTSGTLTSIVRFYLQKGVRIDLPTLYVLPPTDGSHMRGFDQPSITADYCTDIYDRWNGDKQYAPLAQMGKNMENGMVLAMSAWYAKETYPLSGTQTGMSWLDGTNNWGKAIKAGPCDVTTSDAVGPYQATFSDIRIGGIGTTVPNVPARPTPPPAPPSPAPAAGQCCYNGCGGSCKGGWCGASKGNCEVNCSGKWCPK